MELKHLAKETTVQCVLKQQIGRRTSCMPHMQSMFVKDVLPSVYIQVYVHTVCDINVIFVAALLMEL